MVACGAGREGLAKIEKAILEMESSTDTLDTLLQIDMHGMNLDQHSTILMCEVCMRHSVVSYESYLRVTGKWCKQQGFGASESGTRTGIAGLYVPFVSAAEYYLYVACTAGLIRTPRFKHSTVEGKVGVEDIRGFEDMERKLEEEMEDAVEDMEDAVEDMEDEEGAPDAWEVDSHSDSDGGGF